PLSGRSGRCGAAAARGVGSRGPPPVGFTFGLGGLVVFPFSIGASTLLLERATPDELAQAIAGHGVTVLFTAPTMYRALVTAGHSGVLGRLRRCVSAGEHLPPPVWGDVPRATARPAPPRACAPPTPR